MNNATCGGGYAPTWRAWHQSPVGTQHCLGNPKQAAGLRTPTLRGVLHPVSTALCEPQPLRADNSSKADQQMKDSACPCCKALALAAVRLLVHELGISAVPDELLGTFVDRAAAAQGSPPPPAAGLSGQQLQFVHACR